MNAPIDVTDIRIETQRLILRPWRQSDLEDFFEYASVDGVGQMAGWQPHESLEKSQQILNHFISEKKTFALELKENSKVIGSLGLEVRKYCFDTLGYDFISAGHFLRNTRSSHMLQKCGFQLLFEDDFSMHSGRQERIRTYISYNPQKEGKHV